MARPRKGERTPGSGRAKGSRNHASITIDERLAAMNCNPLEALIEIGQLAKQNGELSVAAKCYADVCKYVHPQRKAVEHSGNINGNIVIMASALDERI